MNVLSNLVNPKSAHQPRQPAARDRNRVSAIAEVSAERRLRLRGVESLFHLEAMVSFELEGRQVGAYLLERNGSEWQFGFGFECEGLHSFQAPAAYERQLESLEAGLKDVPLGEHLTLHLSSFRDDRDRQEELQAREQQAPSLELQFLTLAEQGRSRELAEMGARQPQRLRLFATYTVDQDRQDAQSWLEQALAKGAAVGGNFWRSLTGEQADYERANHERLFRQVYEDGFRRWEFLLSAKMGLPVRALSVEELWTDAWQRFNTSPPIAIPHQITVRDTGLAEQVSGELHIRTLLLAEKLPIASRNRLSFPNRQHQVALLAFAEKPGGWGSAQSQLRYLWEVLAREQVYDTEIICQLTRANEFIVAQNVQRTLRQSNLTAKQAQEQDSIDVAATIKTQRAAQVAAQMYEGAVPFYCATVFVVHRPTRRRLDAACQFIESCFRRPAWVVREREYAWRLWFQTLPIAWDALLAKPFERRQLYLSSEVLGLMPLVKIQGGDRQGFELIAAEGRSPVKLDFCNRHRNLMVLGTTRSGKSVLVSGMLTEALSRQIPIVVMDYPKPDGSSTFTDYAKFLGDRGAYFDISRERNNLFELPDLSGFTATIQAERLEDYKEFLASALLAMVLGKQGSSALLEKTCRSILTLALNAFFNDAAIQERYTQARHQGLKSEAWQQTPTLKDFLDYCDGERLNLDLAGGNVEEALQTIRLQLRYWLGSRVGTAISQPSSFRTDVPLLVFALRNLSNEDDAAILSLSAYAAALRRALANPASIFFIDESPILFEYEAIASLIGRLCANGAKAGIRVFISAQDPDTIARAQAAPKIFQNLNMRLIGRIQPSALGSFERILGYERASLAPNAGESYFPDPQGIYSNWLLDDNGRLTPCRYYPSYAGLAVVANNPEEQAKRQAIAQTCNDKFTALSRFKDELIRDLRDS